MAFIKKQNSYTKKSNSKLIKSKKLSLSKQEIDMIVEIVLSKITSKKEEVV